MSTATLSSGSASAWSGKSLVDATYNPKPGQVVLNNSLGAAHTMAGLDTNQQLGQAFDLLNRGTDPVLIAAEDTAAVEKDRFTTAVFLPAGGKARIYYNGTRWEPYSDNNSGIIVAARSFTENATNTVHTATVVLPAGSWLHDIQITNEVLWTPTGAATLKVGDSVDDDGYFTGVNLKATDLLVGEMLKLSDSGAWGGKEGAYMTSAGRRGATSTNFAQWIKAGTSIIGVVTVGTPAAAVGRTKMVVIYSLPSFVAATPSS